MKFSFVDNAGLMRSIVVLLGLAVMYLWGTAATQLPVFSLMQLIRLLFLPVLTTLFLVIALVGMLTGTANRFALRPQLPSILLLSLIILAFCLLVAFAAVSLTSSFEASLALPIALVFTMLAATLVFSFTKPEYSLLVFFVSLPILGFVALNLRLNMGLRSSVLILPAESFGISMPRVAQGFIISGTQHFMAMPSEVIFITAISFGFVISKFAHHSQWVRTPLDRLILGLFVLTVASSIFSRDIAKSFSYVIEGIVIPALLFYVIVNVVKTPEQFHRVLAAMLFFAVSGGAYHMVRIYEATQFSLLSRGLTQVTYWVVRGNPVSSNVFEGGYAYILLMPVAWVLLRATGQSFWIRSWALLALVFGYSSILFSFQRGIWLAAIIQVIILVAFSRRTRQVIVAMIPLIMMGLFLLGGVKIMEGILGMRPTAFLGIGVIDSSILTRLWVWEQTSKLIMAHPITGIGLGTFPTTLMVFDGEWVQNAHHLFLETAVEAGLGSLVLLIAIFAVVLRKGVVLIRSIEEPYYKDLLLALLVSVIGYLVLGVTIGSSLSYKHFILPTLMLWAVIGLIMAYRDYHSRQ